MDIDRLIGRTCKLVIRHFGTPGAFLGQRATEPDASAPVVLLPRNEVPKDARVGDELAVFVHLDSAGRPIASTQPAKLELDQVAFLDVVACSEFGAFVDWGLPKQLLVPFAEQTKTLAVGDREPIGLYRDSSGRLAGTMRVAELLENGASEFELDEWVDGEAWRKDSDIGVFVIVERKFVGLLPKDEPHALSRGQAAEFRVSKLLDDGKMELSLRRHAHQELENDATKILAALTSPQPPRVGDFSGPEQIRRLFGISKKAFKRALGSLLKARKVELDADGVVVVRGSSDGHQPPSKVR
jgi:hypothetical protein